MKKNKIGILTFHRVPNYGAVLQAFALKTYLEKLGNADVSIIDYQCAGNSDGYEPSRYFETMTRSKRKAKALVKKGLVQFFAANAYRKKYQSFCEFSNRALKIARYNDKIYLDYHYLFCGSDQIWNCDITNGFQAPYFGADRPMNLPVKVSSYAASCGDIAEFDEEKREALFFNIKKMDNVGVREKSLADALAAEGIDAELTVDPTFLLDKEEYVEKLNLNTEEPRKPFVLQYALRKDSVLDAVAERVAREKGMRIIKVCGYLRTSPEKGLFSAGPDEFMNLLASAAYVVTNSFHGMALSLIFGKNFNVVLPPGRKARMTDLLNSLGLEARICESIDCINTSPIDYAVLKPVLNMHIDRSKCYIKEILKLESENNAE